MFLVYVFEFRLANPLWADEQTTITDYVLTDLKTTLADYRLPNNHIFFSLTLQVWRLIMGITSFEQIIGQEYLMRIPVIAFSLFGIIYFYQITRLFKSNAITVIGFSILFTSFPYFNYFSQLRGYALSLSLALVIYLHAYKYIISQGHFVHLLITAASSWLLLYTSPSNTYLLVAIFLPYLIKFIVESKKQQSWKQLQSTFTRPNRYINLFLMLGLAGIMTLSSYAVVIGQLWENLLLRSGRVTLFGALSIEITYLNSFISHRWYLVPLVVTGSILLVKRFKTNKSDIAYHEYSIYLLILISLVMGLIIRLPYDRILMPITGFVTISISVLITHLIVQYIRDRRLFIGVVAVFITTNQLVFSVANQVLNSELTSPLRNARRNQTYYAYYLNKASFNPASLSTEIANIVAQHPEYPVILFNNYENPQYYLHNTGIELFSFDMWKQVIHERKRVLIVTSMVSSHEQNEELLSNGSLEIVQLNATSQFHQILLVTKADADFETNI